VMSSGTKKSVPSDLP